MKLQLIDVNFDYKKLANGLEVYVLNDQYSSKYSANYITKFGANDLQFNKLNLPAGSAHFLEHIMFASENGDYFDKYSSNNASANAYTTYNFTNYLFTSPDRFANNLQILVELVTSTYFTNEVVSKEKQIINEEILMYDKQPLTRLQREMFNSLCVNTNYPKDICGTIDSIATLQPQQLKEAHDYFYNYNNQVLLLYGDFTNIDVFTLVEQTLPDRPTYDVEVSNRIEPYTVNKQYSEIYMDDVKIDNAVTAFKLNRFDIHNYDLRHSLNIFLDFKFSDINEKFYELINSEYLPSLTYSTINKKDILAFYVKYEGDDLNKYHKRLIDYILEPITETDVELFLKKYQADNLYTSEELEKLYNSLTFQIGEGINIEKYYKSLSNLQVNDIISNVQLLFKQYDTSYVVLRNTEEQND